MATMTIRNLDEPLKARLRIQAAVHGRSMEDEARDILRSALCQEPSSVQTLVASIRSKIEQLGGFDLEPPVREPIRNPPDLTE